MCGSQPTPHPLALHRAARERSQVGVLWGSSGTSGRINWHDRETAERLSAQVSTPKPPMEAGHWAAWSLPGHLTTLTWRPPHSS